MPLLRTEEILNILAQSTKNAKNNLDTDISSLLEEYLVEAGLRHLNASENGEEICPNFPEIAVILQHSGILYSRKVDHLWSIVQNYVTSTEPPATSDNNEERVYRRTKKQPENLEFCHINLEEATNITMKDSAEKKTAVILPRAFMQFEPRVMSDNDVQIKDYAGTLVGLVSDFKVNWNMDKNFTLCDDMDFSSANEFHKPTENNLHSSMVSPPDSGHNSDSFFDYCDNVLSSPDIRSDRSLSVSEMIEGVTPVETQTVTPVETQTVPPVVTVPVSQVVSLTPSEKTKTVKERKRKLTEDFIKPKPTPTKFDITTPLAGMAKCLKLDCCDFFLPYSIKKIYYKRLKESLNIRNFIEDVYLEGDMNKKYLMNEVSTMFRKRPIMSWTRLEARKKLKLSLVDSDFTHGDTDSDDDQEAAIYNLEKACDRLSSEINEKHDALSVCSNDNYMDDNCIQDDCFARPHDQLKKNQGRQWAESDLNPSQNPAGESSDATRKMEAWHSSILEKIKNMENKKPLELKLYSQRILGSFNGESSTINFSEVLKDIEPEDVSRYFLSTLFLADKCKIVIEQPSPLTCGDFHITLPQDSRVNDDDLNFSVD